MNDSAVIEAKTFNFLSVDLSLHNNEIPQTLFIQRCSVVLTKFCLSHGVFEL